MNSNTFNAGQVAYTLNTEPRKFLGRGLLGQAKDLLNKLRDSLGRSKKFNSQEILKARTNDPKDTGAKRTRDAIIQITNDNLSPKALEYVLNDLLDTANGGQHAIIYHIDPQSQKSLFNKLFSIVASDPHNHAEMHSQDRLLKTNAQQILNILTQSAEQGFKKSHGPIQKFKARETTSLIKELDTDKLLYGTDSERLGEAFKALSSLKDFNKETGLLRIKEGHKNQHSLSQQLDDVLESISDYFNSSPIKGHNNNFGEVISTRIRDELESVLQRPEVLSKLEKEQPDAAKLLYKQVANHLRYQTHRPDSNITIENGQGKAIKVEAYYNSDLMQSMYQVMEEPRFKEDGSANDKLEAASAKFLETINNNSIQILKYDMRIEKLNEKQSLLSETDLSSIKQLSIQRQRLTLERDRLQEFINGQYSAVQMVLDSSESDGSSGKINLNARKLFWHKLFANSQDGIAQNSVPEMFNKALGLENLKTIKLEDIATSNPPEITDVRTLVIGELARKYKKLHQDLSTSNLALSGKDQDGRAITLNQDQLRFHQVQRENLTQQINSFQNNFDDEVRKTFQQKVSTSLNLQMQKVDNALQIPKEQKILISKEYQDAIIDRYSTDSKGNSFFESVILFLRQFMADYIAS